MVSDGLGLEDSMGDGLGLKFVCIVVLRSGTLYVTHFAEITSGIGLESKPRSFQTFPYRTHVWEWCRGLSIKCFAYDL